jgi:hypothetical protein
VAQASRFGRLGVFGPAWALHRCMTRAGQVGHFVLATEGACDGGSPCASGIRAALPSASPADLTGGQERVVKQRFIVGHDGVTVDNRSLPDAVVSSKNKRSIQDTVGPVVGREIGGAQGYCRRF